MRIPSRRDFIYGCIASSTFLAYSKNYLHAHSYNDFKEKKQLNKPFQLADHESVANIKTTLNYSITKNDTLIIVDVQNDFCPGGSLAVKNGDDIISIINSLQGYFNTIVYTQDWHPIDHCCFTTTNPGVNAFESIKMPYGEQVVWPPHCVIDSKGAMFHPNLEIKKSNSTTIKKGFRKELDSYSAFWENDHSTPTGLKDILESYNTKRVFICGLALDFCVHYSAVDAAKLGFKTYVIDDATKPVNLEGTVELTLKNFYKHNIKLITSNQLNKS